MSERDYPLGHPSSSDYKGEQYTPPRAPWAADYDFDHPAYAGKNCGDLDSPDGLRKAVNSRHQDLQELEAIGALPGKKSAGVDTGLAGDPQSKEALEYLTGRGYGVDSAKDILKRFGAEEVLKDKAKQTQK